MKTKNAWSSNTLKTTLAALCLAALPALCRAVPIIAFDPSVTHVDRADGPYTVGSLFQVDQAGGIIVTHLGVQDVGDNGFSGATSVGLWNAAGTTLLASTTVSGSDILIDHYRYVTLATPVTLTQGTSYLLGAVVGGTFPAFSDGLVQRTRYSPFSSEFAGITLQDSVVGFGGAALTAPLLSGGYPGRWGAANALFAVPDGGATLPLLGLACAGMAWCNRRRLASV